MFTCSQNHFNALVGFSNLELIFRSALWDLQCKKKKKEKKKEGKLLLSYNYNCGSRNEENEQQLGHHQETGQ